MTKTGHELADVGRTLSWGALASFVSKLSADSALAQELDPKVTIWATQAKTNAILADIYDVLAILNSNLVAIGSRRTPKKPKRYARPFDKGATRMLGTKDAMPRDEMHAWIEQQRAAYAQRKRKEEAIDGRND